uniref:Rapunzel 2 n=1 Tax=Labrus bergylta TaxID=56723 RepID=A0A3Q3MEI4_9LABR
MADSEKITQTAVKVLSCVEKVSSFASSFNPIFGIVASLVGVARKGLVDEESHALEKDFQEINSKLETISKRIIRGVHQAPVHRLQQHGGSGEERSREHRALLEKYKEIYQRDKSDLSLDVYYRGVMGTSLLFGRTLLKVYMDNCDGDFEIMERRCSHIAHLFHIGLIALKAYTAVTEDDEEEDKMQEVLSQCKPKPESS